LNNIKAYGICLYKIEKNHIKVLLCKSVSSKDRWGFLKGVQEKNETQGQTAIREFHEECGIKVNSKYLENYFEQTNKTKDIGIYLVNYDKINNIESFFVEEKLLSDFLSWENISVKFFTIDKLPLIKTKQGKLTKKIVKYLKGL